MLEVIVLVMVHNIPAFLIAGTFGVLLGKLVLAARRPVNWRRCILINLGGWAFLSILFGWGEGGFDGYEMLIFVAIGLAAVHFTARAASEVSA